VKIKALPSFEKSGSTQPAIKSPHITRTKSSTPVLQIRNVFPKYDHCDWNRLERNL